MLPCPRASAPSYSVRPARFIPTAPTSATQPTRSPLAQLLLVLVLVLVLVLALAPLIVRLAYLAPYFARWEVRRMDVHVSGVRQEGGRDYGKVAGSDVLSRDC